VERRLERRKMNKEIWIQAVRMLVVMLVIIGVIGYVAPKPSTPVQEQLTQLAEAIEEKEAEIVSRDQIIKKEVVYIRETIRVEVSNMGSSDIIDHLNAELALWRRMASGDTR
jgi:predicted PurR-regulated permease PerM